jgi:hypothetical protein
MPLSTVAKSFEIILQRRVSTKRLWYEQATCVADSLPTQPEGTNDQAILTFERDMVRQNIAANPAIHSIRLC